jgi:hypothetical protein
VVGSYRCQKQPNIGRDQVKIYIVVAYLLGKYMHIYIRRKNSKNSEP